MDAGTPETAVGREEAALTPSLDRQLAAGLMAGDPSVLERVYQELGGLVLGISRRVLRDERMAEDVTQEVFTFVWEHPERYDPAKGSLRAWLGLLAHRRSVDRVRAETRHSRLPAVTHHETTVEGEADDRVASDWICQRVRCALDLLPAAQRQAVMMAYFEGHSYRDVATVLAIPEGTVKSRIRLALRRLNEILRADFTEEGPLAWN